MEKLIVSRPRLGSDWDIPQCLDVLIDGKSVSPIGLGETIMIDLPPGPHQVRARIARDVSQSVLVNMARGETHRLAVGTNVGFHRFMLWSVILGMLLSIGLTVGVFIDLSSLLEQETAKRIVQEHAPWRVAIRVMDVLATAMPVLAYAALIRNRNLVLIEIPGSDVEAEQIAELLRARPFRMRFEIWQLMIAIALVAISLWILL